MTQVTTGSKILGIILNKWSSIVISYSPSGTKKMEYKTRQWHEKCFCCVVCKNPIGTKSFIPREQEIYCAGCYEDKFATRCVKCNKVTFSGKHDCTPTRPKLCRARGSTTQLTTTSVVSDIIHWYFDLTYSMIDGFVLK